MKLECDCKGGTTELWCDDTSSYAVVYKDGKLIIDVSDSYDGDFENFRCRKCDYYLDVFGIDLEVN